MDSSAQSDAQADSALSQAIERLWVLFLPEIKDRIVVLQAASEALAAETLSASRSEAAQAAAHKLAGVLGTFGLMRGSLLARELEINFGRKGGPDLTSGKRLAAIAAELREMVESRQSAG